MAKNKVTTYLLYAIGEIILVVIGILIALEVNNQNEVQKNKRLEIKYLQEIRDNLVFDLSDLDFNINFNQSKLASNKVILKYLAGDQIDSLSFHLSNIMFNTRTLVNPSGYESLKSKGLELVTNDSLRINLSTLYEFSIHNLVDFETKDDHTFQYEVFIPEVIKSIEFDFNQIPNNVLPNGKAQIVDASAIYRNTTFKNVISTNILLRQLMLSMYKALKVEMKTSIQLIDDELKVLEN